MTSSWSPGQAPEDLEGEILADHRRGLQKTSVGRAEAESMRARSTYCTYRAR